MSTQTVKHQFCCTIPNVKYHFKNGKEAVFLEGKYYTDVPSEIEELKSEVASGHPNIFVDSEMPTVVMEDLDPIAQIKKKAIEDYIAAQEAATNPENDMGESAAEKLVPANSGVINALANLSNSKGNGKK